MRLFFVGILIVVLEWACGRWFPEHVYSMGGDLTPIAALVGVGIGCCLAGRTLSLLPLMPLALFAAMAGVFVFGNPIPNDDDFSYLFESRDSTLPTAIFAAMLLVFAGPGQELGRALMRSADRRRGAIVLGVGVTAGLAVTTLATVLERSPPHWFGPIVAITVGLLWVRTDPLSRWCRRSATVLILLAAAMCLRTSGYWPDAKSRIVWTGWSRINLDADGEHFSRGPTPTRDRLEGGSRPEAPEEAIPSILRRELEANLPPFRKILLIGTGAGSGLNVLLKWTDADTAIDLLERERLFVDLARQKNPDGPLDHPRVRVHFGEVSQFLRWQAFREPKRYDLILLGSCGARNFTPLTREQIRAIEACLKPDGWFVSGLEHVRDWQIHRSVAALKARFGAEPLILTHPPMPVIPVETLDERTYFTGLVPHTIAIAGRRAGMTLLQAKVEHVGLEESLWLPPIPDPKREIDYFLARHRRTLPPPSESIQWRRSILSDAPLAHSLEPLSDDWPFLEYPYPPGVGSLELTKYLWPLGLLVVSLLAVRYPRRSRQTVDWSAVWTGAAMAILCDRAIRFSTPLLDGSAAATQLCAMLVGLLACVGMAIGFKWEELWNRTVYGLFATSLVLNLLIPLSEVAELPEWARITASAVLLFAPILTGGMISIKRLSKSGDPAIWAGSSILGAVGGLACLPFVPIFGFHALVAAAGIAFLATLIAGNSTNARGTVKS